MAKANQNQSGLPLHTNDPVALAYLMSETLFAIRGEEDGRMETAMPAAETPVIARVENPAETSPAAAQEITFLGKNLSGYLFIFQNHSTNGQHRMPDEEMEAFEKILVALNLSIDHIALINIADHQISLSTLLTFFNPQKMILLGTRLTISGLEQLPDPLTPHQTVTYQKTAFLHTFSFAEMMTDVNKKRQFWNSLKTLLGG